PSVAGASRDLPAAADDSASAPRPWTPTAPRSTRASHATRNASQPRHADQSKIRLQRMPEPERAGLYAGARATTGPALGWRLRRAQPRSAPESCATPAQAPDSAG